MDTSRNVLLCLRNLSKPYLTRPDLDSGFAAAMPLICKFRHLILRVTRLRRALWLVNHLCGSQDVPACSLWVGASPSPVRGSRQVNYASQLALECGFSDICYAPHERMCHVKPRYFPNTLAASTAGSRGAVLHYGPCSNTEAFNDSLLHRFLL